MEPERKRSNVGSNSTAGNLNLDICDLVERVKFDTSSLPTSPTSEEISNPSSIGGGECYVVKYRMFYINRVCEKQELPKYVHVRKSNTKFFFVEAIFLLNSFQEQRKLFKYWELFLLVCEYFWF